jgi:fructoselysine-6-P-deglycase FrlB-like protein
MKTLIDQGNDYLARLRDILSGIAKEPWKNAAILCDGEGFGVAEEASLAFSEIAYTPSICKHVLDVRHGPVVLIDHCTLVIALLTKEGFSYEKALIADLVKKGAYVITVSDVELPKLPGVTAQLCFGKTLHSAARALLLLPVAQLISCFKALTLDLNPDQPDGLDPWIALK